MSRGLKKQVHKEVHSRRWPGHEVANAVTIASSRLASIMEHGARFSFVAGMTAPILSLRSSPTLPPTGQAAGRECWPWPTGKQVVPHEDGRLAMRCRKCGSVEGRSIHSTRDQPAEPVAFEYEGKSYTRSGQSSSSKWSRSKLGGALHPIIRFFWPPTGHPKFQRSQWSTNFLPSNALEHATRISNGRKRIGALPI